jgi:hypothetical protein
LPFKENSVLNFFSEVFDVTFVKVNILCWVIIIVLLGSFGDELLKVGSS